MCVYVHTYCSSPEDHFDVYFTAVAGNRSLAIQHGVKVSANAAVCVCVFVTPHLLPPVFIDSTGS